MKKIHKNVFLKLSTIKSKRKIESNFLYLSYDYINFNYKEARVQLAYNL